MSGATREGILQEVKHGEEVSRGHEHVVTKPARDDAVVHDGLIGLVLKVGFPAVREVRSRPPFEVFELLFSRPDLDTGINSVGGQWACALEVPFFKDPCVD